MIHASAEIIGHLLDAWNAHDVELAETYYAPDFVGVDVGQAVPQNGPRRRAAVLASYIRAFPDVQFTGELIGDGQRVALIWTMCGTHQGSFMRIPPTGRRVEVRGVAILSIKDGKIQHSLNIWDTAGLLRDLGLLPDL